jgi:hypothetical protein
LYSVSGLGASGTITSLSVHDADHPTKRISGATSRT